MLKKSYEELIKDLTGKICYQNMFIVKSTIGKLKNSIYNGIKEKGEKYC